MEIALILFAILFVIIGIALAFYFTNKKSQTTVPEEDPLSMFFDPQIELESIDAVFNPDNPDNVSGYIIEGYAAQGDINYVTLSKNVDLSIKWSNKAGFESVNELIFKRYVGDVMRQSKELTRTKNPEYFRAFERNLKVDFPGSEIGQYSLIGVNKIKIFYKKNDVETELTPANMTGVSISPEDLAQTLDLLAPVVVVYKPALNDNISITESITKTGYYLYPGSVNKSIQEYVVTGTPHGKVYLTPSGDDNTTIKIRVDSNKQFIAYNTNGSFEFNNTGTEFKLVRGELENTVRLSIKVGEVESFFAIDNGIPKMLTTDNINSRDVYNTLDILIRDTGLQKVDCGYEWIDGTPDKATGTRTDTYNIITPSAAGGIACEHSDGHTRTIDVPIACERRLLGYTACTKACDGGDTTESWETTVTAKNKGTDCPAPVTSTCNTQSCKTCKAHDDAVKMEYDIYDDIMPGYYAPDSFRSTVQTFCSGRTDETSCNGKPLYRTSSGYQEYARACEWK